MKTSCRPTPCTGLGRNCPGHAMDIAVGSPNQAWIIGTGKTTGGARSTIGTKRCSIGSPSMAGAQIDIAGSTPWIVNDRGSIYYRGLNKWTRVPLSCAGSIRPGPMSRQWRITGCGTETGGWGILPAHRQPDQSFSSPWTKVSGGATFIDVDSTGRPWIVNSLETVYRRSGSKWEKMPGRGVDVGLRRERFPRHEHFPWLIGSTDVPGGETIHTFSEQTRVGAVGSGGANPRQVHLVQDDRGRVANLGRYAGQPWVGHRWQHHRRSRSRRVLCGWLLPASRSAEPRPDPGATDSLGQPIIYGTSRHPRGL